MAEEASGQAAQSLPVYKRWALLGLALFALSMVLEGIGYWISGDRVGIFFFVGITLIVVALLALILVRFGAWAMIPTVVLALIGWFFLQGYNFYYELLHPESFFDFVPGVIGLAGTLIVLASGIIALVETRRHSVRLTPSAAERGIAAAVVVGLGALFILSGVLTVTGRSTVSAEDKVGAIPVKMREIEFEPKQIDAAAGEAHRVVVTNDDAFLHTFSIEEFDIDVTVRPGSEELIELPQLDAGSYTYQCEVAGHEDMKGTLEVR